MKAFVINLKRRPDRLEDMQRNLGSINLPFERIDAVDARNEDVSGQIAHAKARVYARFDTPAIGQVGVYLSHRKVWQRMVDEHIPFAFIFEDDVLPVNWDPAIVDVDISHHGLDYLRLIENRNAHPEKPLPPVACAGQTLLGRRLTNKNTYGTAAGIMTLQGAVKCLAAGKFWFNIDHFRAWVRIHGLRTALLEPTMFASTDSVTDVMNYPEAANPTTFNPAKAAFVLSARAALMGSSIAMGRLRRLGNQ